MNSKALLIGHTIIIANFKTIKGGNVISTLISEDKINRYGLVLNSMAISRRWNLRMSLSFVIIVNVMAMEHPNKDITSEPRNNKQANELSIPEVSDQVLECDVEPNRSDKGNKSIQGSDSEFNDHSTKQPGHNEVSNPQMVVIQDPSPAMLQKSTIAENLEDNVDEQIVSISHDFNVLSKSHAMHNALTKNISDFDSRLLERNNVQNNDQVNHVEETMEEGEIFSDDLHGLVQGIDIPFNSLDSFDTDGTNIKGGKGSVIRYMQDFTLVQGIGCSDSRLRVKNLCHTHNVLLLVFLEPLISVTKINNTARYLGFKHSLSNVFWHDLVIIDMMEDFHHCKLADIGFFGNPFTWNRDNLWQRLDQILFSDHWINSGYITRVDHLSKTLSDHSPLLIGMKARQDGNFNSFRFQNMWLLDEYFINMNIFSNILIAEEKVNDLEIIVQSIPYDDNNKHSLTSIMQKVEFEKVPDFCSNCKVHGHHLSECFNLNPSLRQKTFSTNINENPVLCDQLPLVNDGPPKNDIEPSNNMGNEGVASEPILINEGADSIEKLPNVVDNMQDLGGNIECLSSNPQLFISVDDMLKEPLNHITSHPTETLTKDMSGENTENGETHNLEIEEGEFVAKSNLERNERTQNDTTHMEALLWNVRGIGGRDSKIRVKNLCRIHNIHLLIIIEPLISSNKLDSTAFSLGFPMRFTNCTNKIWIFWRNSVNVSIISDQPQVVHTQINMFNFNCFASFVYAACDKNSRVPLWEDLINFAIPLTSPWCVGGDFNIISNATERVGGNPPNQSAIDDFNNTILQCQLQDIGFSDSAFTWSRANLWQRLDRFLFNTYWIDNFDLTHVEHLSRTFSDHAPLLLNISNHGNIVNASFRFQNMWLLDNSFMDLIASNWNAPTFPNNNIKGMNRLWSKLSRLKQKLRWWNKHVFKNIFSNILEVEKEVMDLENIYQINSSINNLERLNTAKTNLFKLQDMEEAFWKQKAASKLTLEGDRNTKFFHSLFLSTFENYSGLSISKDKSGFFVGKSVSHVRISRIQNKSGFKQISLPMMYLGTPLYKGKHKNLLFNDIFTNIQKKLFHWSSNLLSYGGRLVLIKSVLNSIPIFICHTIFPTKSVCTRMDRLINKFFWGSKLNSATIHWSAWNKICGPFEEGGLGCKSLTDMSKAFMHAKYCKKWHPLTCSYNTNDSIVWKRLCCIKWEAEQFIQWGLGKGDVYFWQDNWLGTGSIDKLLNTYTLDNIKVMNFFKDGNWWIEKLLEVVPPSLVDSIIGIPLNLQVNDSILYSESPSGDFSLNLAWNSFRSIHDISPIFSGLWHNKIPLSYSILAWRCLRGFISVDDRLKGKGFQGPSKCQCCADIESINHVFINGFIAKKVWAYFYDLTDKVYVNCIDNMVNLFKAWFTPSAGHFFNILPIIIVWFLWKARNEAKHIGKKMEAASIIIKVKDKILELFAANLLNDGTFKNCKFIAQRLGWNNPVSFILKRNIIVNWCKPIAPFYKLNSDGSVKNNRAGGGGIIRTYDGSVLAAFATPIQTNCVLTAELSALLAGINLCVSHGILNVWIEVDAMNVISMLNSDHVNPKNFYLIRNIKNILSQLNFRISHIFREANGAADFLANMGCQIENDMVFSGVNLPHRLKGIVRMDKIGLPYLRTGSGGLS
ncbi:hypothetical protein M5K25_025378 [Dendrobium thyrsiflorum]|uniref:RNase H type-1 domain-containing protein n=1 Tax=Dendrobium thyrsiflorum TaxID=117978 RepID=A0ABD0U469_DENTH